MDERQAKRMAIMTVMASWLAVFCLFGFRATFAVLKVPMSKEMGWSSGNISLGYALMMSIYAVTAFFSGLIIDKWGTKPAYFLAAIFGCVSFWVTSGVHSLPAFLLAYGVLGGIGTGMLWVTSTVSVRKWYVGKDYAKMWGLAFMGGPVAQIVLTHLTKFVIAKAGWRVGWQILAGVCLLAMLIATALAKRSPEYYGAKPFGAMPGAAKEEYVWGVGEAFSTYAVWGVMLTFLCSLIAEFLVWSQAVSYFAQDLGMGLSKAVNIYSIIGIVGVFSMPLMGIVADKIVQGVNHEAKGRKISLIIGPFVGVIACIMLLQTSKALSFGVLSCFLFAVYWAMIPGGVVGYTGAVYGRKTLGKIWGFATLICMGIGPATGSFLGGYFKDVTGRYTTSIIFALCAFACSSLFALTLPLSAAPRKSSTTEELKAQPAMAGR